MADFSTAIQRGGVVTVMNAAVINSNDINFGDYTTPELAYKALCAKAAASDGFKCYIDHFKTANLNASGPTITITGGQDANPLIKFGKTMKCEMNMALCQIDALVALGGVEVEPSDGGTSKEVTLYNGDLLKDGDVITATVSVVDPLTYATSTVSASTTSSVTINKNGGILTGVAAAGIKVTRKVNKYTSYTVTNKFPGAVTIIGDTFVVDQASGEQVPVKIVIYKFLPDAVFNLTQDASNAATFDLNGDVLGVHFKSNDNSVYHGTYFYSIIDASADGTDTLTTAIESYKTAHAA